jgi:hypothetical protein
MRIVPARVARADFADKLGDMREWLDRNNRPLVRFETEADDHTIMAKVEFDASDPAEQFPQAFRCSYAE